MKEKNLSIVPYMIAVNKGLLYTSRYIAVNNGNQIAVNSRPVSGEMPEEIKNDLI